MTECREIMLMLLSQPINDKVQTNHCINQNWIAPLNNINRSRERIEKRRSFRSNNLMLENGISITKLDGTYLPSRKKCDLPAGKNANQLRLSYREAHTFFGGQQNSQSLWKIVWQFL